MLGSRYTPSKRCTWREKNCSRREGLSHHDHFWTSVGCTFQNDWSCHSSRSGHYQTLQGEDSPVKKKANNFLGQGVRIEQSTILSMQDEGTAMNAHCLFTVPRWIPLNIKSMSRSRETRDSRHSSLHKSLKYWFLRPCAFFSMFLVTFFSPNLRGRAKKKTNVQRKKKPHWLSVPDHLTDKWRT